MEHAGRLIGKLKLSSRQADPEMLKNVITRNGGEVIDFDKLRK